MMNKIPVPKNEQGRIAALKLYDILDTPPEQEFDNLAQLAAEICNTPIALINLIDEKRQWTKASVGIELHDMPRESSFCHYTILDDEIFEITNPLADTRFDDNQLVTGDAGIRFYAGIPLINKEGYRLGSLCVMSPKHHQLNSYQRISLSILTASVMSLLELRREIKDAETYKATLDEISVVSILDTHQNLIYANDQFCKMVGLTEEELLGKNISEIKLSDITPEQANSISNSIVERKNWSGVIKNQNIKGIVTWSKLNILPFTGKDNEILKILAVRQDVTQEVLLREQLTTSEALAKTGSWELNIFNRQTTWTQGMYALLDYDDTQEKLNEQSIMSFIHPDDFERVNEVNKKMLEKKTEKEQLDFKIITKKGREKQISAIVQKRYNSKGGLTGIYGTLQDVTGNRVAAPLQSDIPNNYSHLYNNAPCGYFTLDADGYIIDINDTQLRWLNYRREEVAGQMRLKDIVTAESNAFADDSFLYLKNNGHLADTRVVLQRNDGTTLHTLINAKATYNTIGEFLYAQYTVQDIQEIVTLQARLAAGAVKNEHQPNNGQLTFTTDVDGNFLSVSDKLKQATGYNDKDLLGKAFAFAFDEEARNKALEFYREQLHEIIENTTYVLPVKTKEGSKLWMQQDAEFILEDSNIVGFSFVLTDVSDQRKAAEQVEEARTIASEAQNRQEALLGKVNLDVRTPLSAVMGMVNLLGTTPLSIEQKVLLGGIKESAANMLKSIDTIVDGSTSLPGLLNKTSTGETDFELKPLVNSLIITLKPEADKKNIRFILQVDNKIPTSIIADPVRLTKILQCLTENALKHTEKGSISISVLQKVIAQNLITLEFIVKDTGIGIPLERLNNIFENKTKPQIAVSEEERFSLILAKQLIEEHNGVLKVKSQEGMGTTFSFTFQCKQVNNTAAERATEINKTINQDTYKTIPEEKISLGGYNILLVEDNIMNQRVGRVTVENWGANVTVVDRGRKAVELLTTNKFDVILMDIQMPEMSGIEATVIIRKELKLNIPILGMTVSEMQGSRDMCLKAGMNDYILKPLNPVELHKKIIALINKPEQHENDKLINISYIRSITDNDVELIREILEIYITRTPELINELDENIIAGDFKQVKAGVHYLKNSVGLLGADTLFHLLATIEDQLNYLPPSDDTLTLLSKMRDSLLQSISETEDELDMLL